MPRPLRFLFLALLLAPGPALAQPSLSLDPLGTYATGIFDEGAAEIVAYDRATQRLFFVNADAGQVQALDISDPATPTLVLSIDVPGGGVNSIAVRGGIVAVAAEADESTDPGSVRFYSNKGALLGSVPVGVLPDGVAFSEDGRYLVVANEGEPNDEYTIDPEGSISVIDLQNGVGGAVVTDVGFGDLDEEALDESVRIFGPGATVAQDLEPEYVAIRDGLAYVTLQENNAVAVVDLATATLVGVEGLGFKDWSDPENMFDASNEDGGINFQNWPVFGIYQPDAIETYEVDGQTYLVTANEGDARDYDGFSEEERVADLTLDPTAFPDAATLQLEENLGRLNITLANGDTDGDGDYDELYAYGARSFSIWTLGMDGLELVYDSADDLEQITAALLPDVFNSTNDDNDSFDNRSDDKGPEPEGVALGEIDGRTYAFVGLERIGGVIVYDITDPAAPTFVDYVNNRDFSADAESPEAGDLGPEGLVFIPAADSPTGQPLLVVSNEVSGTVTTYGVTTNFTLAILHNNDGESDLLSEEIDGIGEAGGIALFADVVETLRADDGVDASVLLSSGDNFLAGPEFNASLDQGPPYYDALGLSLVGYDALAIGNHEFDFGPDVLAAFVASFPEAAPFLSANLDVSAEPALASLQSVGRIAERVVVERGGRSIGIIGATTPALRTISSPRNVEVLQDVQAEVQAEIDALQAEGVGIILLISHLQGIDEDLALIEGLSGLDVAIAGGGDELLANDDDVLLPGDESAGAYPLEATDADGETVPVATTAGGYQYVGRLVVEFDADGDVVAVLDESGPVRVAAADGYTADAEIESLVVAPVEAYVADLQTTVIGETEVPLDGRREAIRFEETNLGDLIADAYLWQADELNETFGAPDPDVALANGGGIRNDDIIPVGDLTEFDTFDILPFSNFLTIVEEVPAATFKDLLENAYSRIATGPSPSGSGRFAQVAGFTVFVDTTGTPIEIEDGEITTPGARIQRVVLDDGTVLVDGGAVVDDAPAVNVATVDFTARGGDEFLFGNADLTILGVTYQQTLSNYVQQSLGGLVAAADYPEGGNGRIELGGMGVPTEEAATPLVFSVDGLYPNPLSRATTLAFGLPSSADVEVVVYDVLGREVLREASGALAAGTHDLRLDAAGWASGVYVYRLTAAAAGQTWTATGRMTVVR
jgi:2',3'-cyclic-nucleotide 2'-phosphodiesterase (5'-nucleotidase family)